MTIQEKFTYYSNFIAQKTQKDGSNFSNRPAVQRALKKLLNFITEKNILHQGSKVLDIGAGGGQVSKHFEENFGASCWGITLNENEVKLAQEKGMKLKKADMHDLPFADNHFDTIYAAHVLEHSVAPLIALLEWRRVLKVGGSLILWGPVGRDFKGQDDGTVVFGCKDHLLTPTLWQYKWLFELADLTCLHEFDLPYQIESNKQQEAYEKFNKKLHFLSKFKLTILPQFTFGTARVFVLKKAG